MIKKAAIALSALFCLSVNAGWAEPAEELLRDRIQQEIGGTGLERLELKYRSTHPSDISASIITDFWMDENSHRFLANVVTDDYGVLRYDGFAISYLDIPVASERLMPGDIVEKGDVKIASVPVQGLPRGVLTDRDSLVGMQVDRLIRSGKAFVEGAVIEPHVIERGEKVTIKYVMNSMTLEADGKALSDAALGDEVRVINRVSSKTVYGKAAENGYVIVE